MSQFETEVYQEAFRRAMAFINAHVSDPDLTEDMIKAHWALQNLDPDKLLAGDTQFAANTIKAQAATELAMKHPPNSVQRMWLLDEAEQYLKKEK